MKWSMQVYECRNTWSRDSSRDYRVALTEHTVNHFWHTHKQRKLIRLEAYITNLRLSGFILLSHRYDWIMYSPCSLFKQHSTILVVSVGKKPFSSFLRLPPSLTLTDCNIGDGKADFQAAGDWRNQLSVWNKTGRLKWETVLRVVKPVWWTKRSCMSQENLKILSLGCVGVCI